jgi:hypothetical protein
MMQSIKTRVVYCKASFFSMKYSLFKIFRVFYRHRFF